MNKKLINSFFRFEECQNIDEKQEQEAMDVLGFLDCPRPVLSTPIVKVLNERGKRVRQGNSMERIVVVAQIITCLIPFYIFLASPLSSIPCSES